MSLKVEMLTYSIQQMKILDAVSIEAKSGEFVGLIGPNGSGKSTLLKHICRIHTPDNGEILLKDKNIREYTSKELARCLSFVSQESSIPYDFTVSEIVMMGRTPFKKLFDFYSKRDKEIVDTALERVGLQEKADWNFNTLSGGEKKRVHIARGLAQQAEYFILDEPTNHLDIKYQLQIMELVKELRITSLAALHDLNLAAAYCDRIYVLKEGRILYHGSPEDVMEPSILREVFEVESEIIRHPNTKKLQIAFGAQQTF